MGTTRRAAVIQRFENRERARQQMRFFELSSLAGIYANDRCRGNIDAAYRELIKSLDDVGFLGSRILYLDPDIQPPYFPQPRKSEEDELKWLPHKQNPIITRQFIEAREKELGWALVRDAYLAKSLVLSLPAAQWLQSKGITPPSSLAWTLKIPEAAHAESVSAPDRPRSWKPNFDNELTMSEAAICDAFNVLWPNGDLDHKARGRDRQVNAWLRQHNKSTLSSRSIQRALRKIGYR